MTSNQIQGSALVILGASGDLARRKLLPALDKLFQKGAIGSSCRVIGSGRSAFTDEAFRNRFPVTPGFAPLIHYHQGMVGLKAFLSAQGVCGRVVFFMALPPSSYAETAAQLAAEGFGEESSIIVEKPFGYDLASAQELDRSLARYFSEDRIYRIDHYLAKEAVQNILVFRFANSLFEPLWNSHYIESIQINAVETSGVGERGSYFDRAGIIRDMVQNHLVQLLSLLTMEPPVSLKAEDIRQRKIDVIRCLSVVECYCGQYEGYGEEAGVSPGSTTETYAEFKLLINNLRWAGTPVFLRTGKSLNRSGTEIGFVLKQLPSVLFNQAGDLSPNRIIIKIQPDEGIIVDLVSKVPGTESVLKRTHMDFCYRHSFDTEVPEAYQRLLLDALRQDHTLFVGAEEAEMSWRIFTPFLDSGKVISYARGAMPQSRLDVEWIDFEQYVSVCA